MRGLTSWRPAVPTAALAAFVGLLALAAPPAGAAQPRRELPALLPPGNDGLARALIDGRLSEAEYALERTMALYRPARARRLFGDIRHPGPREGTVILRDLAARIAQLDPAERARAERILARPTDRHDEIHGYRTRARRVCDVRMCFWWVTETSDAPRLGDRNRNRIPDWVDRTRAVFRAVWATEVGAFRFSRPLSDLRSKNHGPNRKLDVYVADVGSIGLYGYCTSDDPARARRRSVSAYCVVDDDFARSQFEGAATGLRALKVTAAHEFFHAVQFAYDWLEDLWLMEGSAAWIEDEVYDRIDDNLQYLRTSPVSTRFFFLPLDYYNPDPSEIDAGFKYGAWIFFRYLSERYGRDVVRSVWRRADARRGAPDEYSIQAVESALFLRGDEFGSVFADFGVANVHPSTTYAEGARYPTPRPTRTHAVGPAGVARSAWTMYHLSNDYLAFVPRDLPPEATLSLTLDLPPPETSPAASALVENADGTVVRVPAAFDVMAETWRIDVAGFGSTRRVVLVLTNGSTRYRCWQRSVYSCRGRPLDDVDFHYQAAVS
ncbi:MAG TPA: MXAN_6640 family putative metalloprotease [Gaiellaceae bacterium]|nr:MXAN_6640 family putative metalloprotease [Gaiellaceae bacterium]